MGLSSRAKAGQFHARAPSLWGVEVPRDTAYFYDKNAAIDFALANNHPSNTVFSRPRDCIAPQTMRWIIKQRAKGLNTGSLFGRILHAHPDNFDDMLAWFKREPDAAAAKALLDHAFSLGRLDAADAVGQWARETPQEWFSPNTLMGLEEEDMFGHRHDMHQRICLFGRLMQSPATMEWFLNAQIDLKHAMQEPAQWRRLQEGLALCDPNSVSIWPATAKRAFNVDVSPIQENWTFEDSKVVRNTLASYAHSPAAQCYIVHKHLTPATVRKSTEHLVSETSPEVVELYHRFVRENCSGLHQVPSINPALRPRQGRRPHARAAPRFRKRRILLFGPIGVGA